DRAVEQAAAVVLDNETGEVLAWVGSPNFWSPNDGQTDMIVSPRQPGSALKPFLYGLAFDGGVTAATVLPDLPKAYATAAGSYTCHSERGEESALWRWRRPPRDVTDGERARSRHSQRPRRAHPRLRHQHALRFSLPRRREDGHEPPLHRQLGGGHDARLHRRR